MHCPRCGQQQVSEQTKFCSRCGFQLGLVAELLNNGGVLPQLNELYKKRPKFFSKKNGVIFSALWFIFFVMMLPAFFGIANAEDAAGISAVFGLFTTMMFLVISLAALPSSKPRFQLPDQASLPDRPHELYGPAAMNALPPQQSQPASSYAPPAGGWKADTADFSRPGSVTEGTTRLLEKEMDEDNSRG